MPPSQTEQTVNQSANQTFRRASRIRRRSDYLRIQQHGKRVHTSHFVMIVLSHQSCQRLGITVTKRISRAVGRNRIKRLVREVFRRNRYLFPDHCDVVMVARNGAEKLNYESVKEEVQKARAAMVRAAIATRSCSHSDKPTPLDTASSKQK